MNVIVRHSARVQIYEAAEWYQAQSFGLGGEFADEVEEEMLSIAEAPLQYPLAQLGARRLIMRRFPIAIYFVVRGEEIHIFAVVHMSRDPRMWQRLVPRPRRRS